MPTILKKGLISGCLKLIIYERDHLNDSVSMMNNDFLIFKHNVACYPFNEIFEHPKKVYITGLYE